MAENTTSHDSVNIFFPLFLLAPTPNPCSRKFRSSAFTSTTFSPPKSKSCYEIRPKLKKTWLGNRINLDMKVAPTVATDLADANTTVLLNEHGCSTNIAVE
jgi:hypothetical protein